MPFRTASWSRFHLETLMAIASTLGEYTQSLELAQRIPAYLSDALGAEPLTLAILRDNGHDESQLVLHATSGAVGTGEAALTLEPQLLEICRQTRPLAVGVAPSLRSSIGAGFSELDIPGLGAYPKALVFCRSIDSHHRLVLLMHQRADENGMHMPLTEALQTVAGQLAKLFKCLFAWQAGPQVLGGPFERLTDREWMVLRGLNSDDGEKQLADRLSLSPHTLHSHIKSIYRKVGVQGRLPLLARLQTAMRELRTTTLNTRDTAAPLPMVAYEQPRAAAFA
ncbi:MAG TPA: LuxR C-terminal-related transcriptional regulator [Phycisphaerae bacterium]|nr:LuxR C-terminal-related transcriptional regulator [Phycisphaerae bacterium]